MLCFNMFRLLVDFLVRYPSGYRAKGVFSLVDGEVVWQRSSVIHTNGVRSMTGEKCFSKRTNFLLPRRFGTVLYVIRYAIDILDHYKSIFWRGASMLKFNVSLSLSPYCNTNWKCKLRFLPLPNNQLLN